jgi:hypothetical protein
MLEEIKDVLDITWSDEDAKIQRIIDAGKNNLETLAGGTLDFTVPGLPKYLLKNHCRYDYNNASEYFEENFHQQIIRLQIIEGIKSVSEDDA